MQKETIRLDFAAFIGHYYPEFKIDDANHAAVKTLGLWASRSPAFDDPGNGKYLDKGLFISGPVGTGKTELLRLTNNYLKYLKSNYTFSKSIVWKFSEIFKRDGHQCFTGHEQNNRYYDELALTDEVSGWPVGENVQHYGDKILIGERLIMLRYNSFKERGYQSHFSTNCSPSEIQKIYGNRAFSRLMEMCNFVTIGGSDRRATVRPTFYNNMNQSTPPAPAEIPEDEIKEHKKNLNRKFTDYVKTGVLNETASFDYITLKIYGCDMATEDELRSIMDSHKSIRLSELNNDQSPYYNERRFRELRKQYEAGNLDEKESGYIWSESRKTAVMMYYEKLRIAGAKEIFEIVV